MLVVGCSDGAQNANFPADAAADATLKDVSSGDGFGGFAGSDSGADAGSDADAAADSASKPPPGNALLRSDGSVVPLYPVTDALSATRAIGFVADGSSLTAIDEDGATLWTLGDAAGALFGGFDFDSDGWPDVGLARSKDSGQKCGGQPALDTWLDAVRGKSGKLISLTTPLPAKCWTFPSSTYPTPQWTNLGVLFGSGATLAVAPYYATDGTFLTFDGAGFSSLGSFVYPSTATYDSSYAADKPNTYPTGTSFIANSHVANGLVLAGSPDSLAFFTSSRFVRYSAAPLSSSQLTLDLPYLTGGRTDIAGRNYGLVARDPGDPRLLLLVAGTGAFSLFDDMGTGTLASDAWGAIERHVSLVNLDAGSVDDRFFSYAHDNSDGNKYEGRVVYSTQPFVRVAGKASRLAFNVYAGGHWWLHVTQPGSTKDAISLKDVFLWDIADLDGDGVDECLLSPSRDPGEPDVPGYYFVKWRTELARWNETSLSFTNVATHQGVLPYLKGTLTSPDRTSSYGALHPALRVRTQAGLELVVKKSSGEIATVPVGGP